MLQKITINNILDYPEFYKDKDLIRFLRKNNPDDDEFYEYENEMIKDIRKNNQRIREIKYKRILKDYGIKDSDYDMKITKEIIDDYKEKFFKKHRIITNKENELKYKNEILDNLKNDNEIKKFDNIKEAVIKINKKDPIMDLKIYDISNELHNTTERSN